MEIEVESDIYYMDGWCVVLPDGRVLGCSDAPHGQFDSKAKAELTAALIPGATVEVLHTLKTEGLSLKATNK